MIFLWLGGTSLGIGLMGRIRVELIGPKMEELCLKGKFERT